MAGPRPLTERQKAVLLILLAQYEATGSTLYGPNQMTPNEIGSKLDLPPARRVHGPWAGQMGPAQRVIGTLNGLHSVRGLISHASRRDGLSGSAYRLTLAGIERALALREAS